MLLVSALGLIFGLICSIHIAVPFEDIDSIVSCVLNKPCIAALASLNPIMLKCHKVTPKVKVSWQYLDLHKPHSHPITFISDEGPIRNFSSSKTLQLIAKSTLVAGNLRIKNPTEDNTGVYTCKDGKKTLAYYEIDFQDMEQVHISYGDLGESIQENISVALEDESKAEIFTLWSEWQPCDRCGRQGERKRVGFCYSEVIKGSEVVGPLLPCGLQRLKFKQIPLARGPELRIETCTVNCSDLESPQDEIPLLMQNSYHTDYNALAKLTCPRSSVYRPIYWKEGNHSLTRLELQKRNGSHILDNATGGGTLFISYVRPSDTGLYKCYMNNKLMAKFHVSLISAAQTGVQEETYGFIESVAIGTGFFLVFLMLLSILQACHRIRR